ncbi:MAG: NAD-dependent protein deacylase [Thermosipho sp. (in: Bacteria)]|nr:NAD-dependent protein deacylase [Thermosipho sp. (in: thermotogales)]
MIKNIVEIIKNYPTVVLTGAGISTESGIPDFRSKNGIYSKYSEEIFNIDFFYNHPEKFYKILYEIFHPMYSAKPNTAHKLLAKLEKQSLINGIITQNIDNLHFKAGSTNVIELHGNATKFYCTKCKKNYSYNEILNSFKCNCGGLIRPDIVFFGEELPKDQWENALNLVEKSKAMLIMGSSLVVYPAAYLPVIVKKNHGKIIIINKGPTALDDLADIKMNISVVDFANLLENYLCLTD